VGPQHLSKLADRRLARRGLPSGRSGGVDERGAEARADEAREAAGIPHRVRREPHLAGPTREQVEDPDRPGHVVSRAHDLDEVGAGVADPAGEALEVVGHPVEVVQAPEDPRLHALRPLEHVELEVDEGRSRVGRAAEKAETRRFRPGEGPAVLDAPARGDRRPRAMAHEALDVRLEDPVEPDLEEVGPRRGRPEPTAHDGVRWSDDAGDERGTLEGGRRRPDHGQSS
jgi:hypothetical protein